MNKVLERLYSSLLEDDALNSEEIEMSQYLFQSVFTDGMSSEKKGIFYEMLNNYSSTVEKNAFEVGFETAVRLLTGAGQE